jgi:AraC-like DNA-binding protein/CheY-like chemotaxis protein
VRPTLSIVWISCSSGNSAVELLKECQQACVVHKCVPSRALATLIGAPPTIVIFDYGDPNAADLHLLQSVKRHHPALPILMLTDTHSEELAVWAMRARVWNYLVKPVPLRELKTNLAQLAKLPPRQDRGAREILRPATTLPMPYRVADPHGRETVFRRIVEDIRRDSFSGTAVAQLARNCGMSRFTFSRMFTESFGISYRDFVMRTRLEKACKMLEQPGSSVTSVAHTAGFTDASYFARVFKRHIRKSPKQYARAARSQQKIDQLREIAAS